MLHVVMDCRGIGERSDAVLRPAMPGNDVERLEQPAQIRRVLLPPPVCETIPSPVCKKGNRLMRFAATLLSGILALAPLLASPLLNTSASAQSWPSRAIKVIVPFPAGGVADIGA